MFWFVQWRFSQPLSANSLLSQPCCLSYHLLHHLLYKKGVTLSHFIRESSIGLRMGLTCAPHVGSTHPLDLLTCNITRLSSNHVMICNTWVQQCLTSLISTSKQLFDISTMPPCLGLPGDMERTCQKSPGQHRQGRSSLVLVRIGLYVKSLS